MVYTFINEPQEVQRIKIGELLQFMNAVMVYGLAPGTGIEYLVLPIRFQKVLPAGSKQTVGAQWCAAPDT
jgi:hypothetical protein